MSSLSQFTGSRGAPKPTGELNGTSAIYTSSTPTTALFTSGWVPAKRVQSGATTAGVLKTILSLSGAGVISLFALGSTDATSRTHRVKITLDGTVILDATTAAVATTANAYNCIGVVSNTVASTMASIQYEPLAFTTSLLVEYADSLSETDGAQIVYRYYPT